MIRYKCIVQEACVPPKLRPDLESGLARVAVEVLGGSPDEIEVAFREIPRGAGYRGGELSTTSLVPAEIPPGCDQATREKFLMNICDMWCAILGCDPDDLVASAHDSDYVAKVF